MKFDISISIDRRELISVRNFSIMDKGITFLLGESGIGKSMIAKAVYGLLDPDVFSVRINDQDYSTYLDSSYCRNVQANSFFVFQEPSSHLNPLIRIADQLNEGSLAGVKFSESILQSLWPDSDPSAIKKLTNIFPQPFRPSGGEKQRILLAMALKKLTKNQPENDDILFVFDEPTGSLDNINRDIFLDLLFRHYRKHPAAVLMISHDYSMISRINKKYPDLLGSISFQEISRSGNKISSLDFSAVKYLSWLDNIKPNSPVKKTAPLLSLDNNFEIYGRRYRVSSDPAGKNEAKLQIYPDDLVYLKAGSGVGKTTLAKILIGLNRADNLTMEVDGLKVTDKTSQKTWRRQIWANKIGMVFQHADEALNLNARVRDVFSGLPRNKRPDSQQLAQYLSFYFENYPGEQFTNQKIINLSGGQKQRLNLIRTFLLQTKIIILDEPLNGLDFDSMCKIIEIIRRKKEEGQGILMISHNEEIFDAFVPEERRYYLHCENLKD